MASDLPLILSGSALALGLVGSALASGLETGFYVLDPVQLRHRALGGDTAARRVEQERRQPGRLLALLLLLTNSMNYLATFGLGGLLAHLATNEGLAIAIEALVITPSGVCVGRIIAQRNLPPSRRPIGVHPVRPVADPPLGRDDRPAAALRPDHASPGQPPLGKAVWSN